MVIGGDSIQEVVGSNPGAGYLKDIFPVYCCKKRKVCLKRPKIND